jgi:uncharacterized protein DUF2652
MVSGRSLLLIADIGGYTAYMGSHRMSLAHAEVNTGRLLEKVINAAPDFDLIEIEGDAAFLARQADTSEHDAAVAQILRAAMAMHREFHLERQYVAANLCPCNGCSQANNLKLKFVAHIGDVATQTIRQRRKLVGIDVIQVHRMLKNPVEVPEYVLMSDELYRTADGQMPGPSHEVAQDLEGIGPALGHFVDVADLPASHTPLPDPKLLGRVGRTLSVAVSGMPAMLGLRRRTAPAV